MNVMVHGRNVDVSDWMKGYITKKVDKLERYLKQITDVRAELSHNSTRAAEDRYTAQITIWAGGQLLRAEESTSDIVASIDMALDKIANQIRRFKGKKYDHHRRAAQAANREAVGAPVAEEVVEEDEEVGHILRHKQFVVEPMNEEEAVEQMELLGHSFFLFFNPADAGVNLVYKRKDGNYGVLQPTVG